MNAKSNINREKDAPFMVRKATMQDARALNLYIRDIYASSDHLVTRPEEFRLSVWGQRRWLLGKLSNKLDTCLLAVEGDTIIGMLDSWTDSRARVRHVTSFAMSVRDGYRRRGVGRALLQQFVSWVSAQPTLKKIELHVHATNHAAIALYEQMGFQLEGSRIAAIHDENKGFIDDLIMAHWPNSSIVE